ncbi:ImmA/IrrE family metallo-endopeptidase [Pseudobacillus badius]|uniref:ImmA/IrrE family metallo-endopeptidase n=1 Tax=Bacillus badius TaxID=1455 RepID=UPI0006992335|nr:ImmA/IrrE family metallo-endopeptidase [Bacillus badius]KZN99397.1 hypothetical protein A4244_18925 [Bacillus badius]OCS84984.1 hypothetical protein A6M11_18940 [Bacillus badius]OVE49206.1 hypothetical protein B1A98_16735 [Bacillus badius]TDW00812.1 uncharacterized protein DUF955 [Bacillus badius]
MIHSTLLEDYIFSLYQSIHIYTPDQLNMKKIASRIGVDIEYIDSSSKTLYPPQETIILIDRRLSSQKQWQDFGHELGHLLRHFGSQLTLPPPFIKMQEWQANNFYVSLLCSYFHVGTHVIPLEKK